MIYQYAPKLKKQIEKTVCLLLAFLSAFCYAISMGDRVLYPAALQLLAFLSLAFAILIASGYLLRSYVYCVEENPTSSVPDFTVTELRGKRRAVVCRVSLRDIVKVEQIHSKNKRELLRTSRSTQRYDYTASMSYDGAYLLTVMQGDTAILVRILANEGLLRFFLNS